MHKTEADFNEELNKLLEDSNYFIQYIGDKQGNAYKDTLLPNINEKKRDYLSTTLNPLASAQDMLKTKILSRSTGSLTTLVEDTIKNLDNIMQEIRLHDNKIINESDLVIDTHKIFKYTKRDILKLTYYSLIELYHRYGYFKRNFKSEALQQIRNKFGENLDGDALEISLIKIKCDTKTLFPKNVPKNKIICPTFGITI